MYQTAVIVEQTASSVIRAEVGPGKQDRQIPSLNIAISLSEHDEILCVVVVERRYRGSAGGVGRQDALRLIASHQVPNHHGVVVGTGQNLSFVKLQMFDIRRVSDQILYALLRV